MTDRAADDIRRVIERHGPISFSRFQDLALYGNGGFYESGGAGRERDFLTSPEVGPLFGAVIGRWLDSVWEKLDHPDPFLVVEVGAGPGSLAAAVLAADPDCASVLRYVLVDRSGGQRSLQRRRLPIVPPVEAFAAVERDVDGEPLPASARGPLVVALESIPRQLECGVVLANELLDNLPVDLLERTADGWSEVRVGVTDGAFTETLVPATTEMSGWADRVAPRAEVGRRIPVQQAAQSWLRDALEVVARGSVLVIDYMRSTPELAAIGSDQWLRTYRGHRRADDPLVEPGSADITCDVALDQLAAVENPQSISTQAEWLRANGMDELVEEGRRVWAERAAIGDLVALQARSRIGESEALTDPAGLGGFTVVEWCR